jgi:hypothetical protein
LIRDWETFEESYIVQRVRQLSAPTLARMSFKRYCTVAFTTFSHGRKCRLRADDYWIARVLSKALVCATSSVDSAVRALASVAMLACL